MIHVVEKPAISAFFADTMSHWELVGVTWDELDDDTDSEYLRWRFRHAGAGIAADLALHRAERRYSTESNRDLDCAWQNVRVLADRCVLDLLRMVVCFDAQGYGIVYPDLPHPLAVGYDVRTGLFVWYEDVLNGMLGKAVRRGLDVIIELAPADPPVDTMRELRFVARSGDKTCDLVLSTRTVREVNRSVHDHVAQLSWLFNTGIQAVTGVDLLVTAKSPRLRTPPSEE